MNERKIFEKFASWKLRFEIPKICNDSFERRERWKIYRCYKNTIGISRAQILSKASPKISPSIILDRKRIYTRRKKKITDKRFHERLKTRRNTDSILYTILSRIEFLGISWNTSREELKARDEIERRIVRLSRPNGSPIPTSGPFSPLVPGERLLIPGRRKKKNPSSRRDANFLGRRYEVWSVAREHWLRAARRIFLRGWQNFSPDDDVYYRVRFRGVDNAGLISIFRENVYE